MRIVIYESSYKAWKTHKGWVEFWTFICLRIQVHSIVRALRSLFLLALCLCMDMRQRRFTCETFMDDEMICPAKDWSRFVHATSSHVKVILTSFKINITISCRSYATFLSQIGAPPGLRVKLDALTQKYEQKFEDGDHGSKLGDDPELDYFMVRWLLQQ